MVLLDRKALGERLVPSAQLSRNVSGTLLYFYFDQKWGGAPKTFKDLKGFEFFLFIAVLLMLSYFLWYLMHSVRCAPIIRNWIFKYSFRYFTGFLFWSTKWRDAQNIEGPRTFYYCSIIDTKLIFVPMYSVVSDA